MGQDDKNELQLFEDIIRGQELRDEGIVSHGIALREFEAEINERYVERGFIAIPEEDLEALEEKANDHWPYAGEVATVSGRLEIIFDEEEEILRSMLSAIAIPDATGEILHPLDEELYYIDVEKAKIRSGGAVLDAISDDDGKLENVRVGYTFYLLSDTEEEVPLFAQPDALDVHTYDTPTPAEARARLEHGWSSQLEGVDSIIRMDETLPHRLMLLTETFNDELKDATFRKLVELYIQDELALDMEMPYMVVVRDRVDCLDDIADDNGTWRQLAIEGALTLFVNEPEVCFSSVTEDDEKEPEAYVFGMTYNDNDGSKPEVVAIPVRNIERFFATRASTSLAERALASMDRELEADTLAMAAQKSSVKFNETAVETDTPEYIAQLEIIEEAIQRSQKLADEYIRHSFSTQEDAKEDAIILLEKIKEQLNGTIFTQGAHWVQAMGEGIKVANLRYNLEWNEELGAFLQGADKEHPIVHLPLGDRVVGTVGDLHAVAESTLVNVGDDEGGVVFYTPRVVMAVRISDYSGLTIDSEPALSQVKVLNQAAVPLDSSSDIQFTVLDQHRASLEAVQRATKVYGSESPLVERIKKLQTALSNEDQGYTQLDIALLEGFASDYTELQQRNEPTGPILSALEAMLSNSRSILSASEVYRRTAEGEYVPDIEASATLRGWTVVDIQEHPSNAEILLFVKMPRTEAEYRYIPLSTITELRF